MPAQHVPAQEPVPVHDLLAGVAALEAAVESVATGAGRAWSCSDAQVLDVVEAVSRVAARVEAARLAVIKVLDDRPGAVPGAQVGKVAATFLTGRLHVDPGRASADVRAAHVLDAETGDLPQIGAALAAGQITREHAEVCVRAVSRLPRRLKVVVVDDAETGERRTGMQVADGFLAAQCRRFPVRTIGRLVDELVRVLDPDRTERFDEDAHLRRRLSLLREDSTGMGLLRVNLTPADAAVLAAVLAAAAKPDPAREIVELDDHGVEQVVLVRDDRTQSMRQYDAFTALLRAGLTGEPTGTPLVNLLITATLEHVAAAAAAEQARHHDTAPSRAHADRHEHHNPTDPTHPTGSSSSGDDGDGTADRTDAGQPEDAVSPIPETFAGNRSSVLPGECSVPGCPLGRDRSCGTDCSRRSDDAPGTAPDHDSGPGGAAAAVGRAAGSATLHRHGPIGPHLLAYLTCTATLTRVLLDPHGAPLDVGRTHRLATPAQRKALAARDAGCIIPGCAVPHEGTDAHHLRPWHDGGATDLTNMVSLCARHHQEVHAGIWTIRIRNGIPWVRPPTWIDPRQRWTRNLHHHTTSAARRLGRQLRIALDDHSDPGLHPVSGVSPDPTPPDPTPPDPTPPDPTDLRPSAGIPPTDDTWGRAG